jgi:hypothetical protein
VASF